MAKALFLDRDGIINVDRGYVYQWENFEWINEIFDILSLAKERGYLVIVLTNQSGIARGMYTEADVAVLHGKMSDFLAQKNLSIDDFFYCPDFDSNFRKPAPGMIYSAKEKYKIDLGQSFMVGDKISDVLMLNQGDELKKTFLVQGNYEFKDSELKKLNDNVVICTNHQELLQKLVRVL